MSIKEAFKRAPQPVEVTKPELDDFVRRTRIAGYRNLYDSGALELINDLRKLINDKDDIPTELWTRLGTKRGSARWGKGSDPEAQKLNPEDLISFPKGRPKIWERTDVYALRNGLCEVALEWDERAGYGHRGEDVYRMSILSHPVSGDLLIKGYAQVLIHKSDWESEKGRVLLEDAIAYVSTRPQYISRHIPNPQIER